MATPLKIIRSHVGYSRFLAECYPAGYIPFQKQIPSPYRYSQVDQVWDWKGKKVFVHETSHKVYQIHAAPAEIFATDIEAEAVFFKKGS